jgi:hypothetical protein
VFTVFAVTGVAHSMNVIDGLNGLSGMIALLASTALAIVAVAVGDSFVLGAACVLEKYAHCIPNHLMRSGWRIMPHGVRDPVHTDILREGWLLTCCEVIDS